MRRKFFIFLLTVLFAIPALGASKTADRFINKSLYENVYPYTLNEPQQQRPYIGKKSNNTYAKNNTTTGNTSSMSNIGKRRVVKRTTNARAAAAQQSNGGRRVVSRSNTARSGTSFARNAGRNSSGSNVMARAAQTKSNARYTKTHRSTSSSSSYSSTSAVSSQRCFADYKECMESYCERADTPYNRCYCSAKLAQIDAKYQNKIDKLIQQIVRLKYNADVTDDEIKEYWDETVGSYTQTNPWVNIDNALNIDWASTESRVRGQNAFVAGHKYCVINLKACQSMATNMRDAYKSEIARDCETYEKSLQRIQSAAESVIESYDD